MTVIGILITGVLAIAKVFGVTVEEMFEFVDEGGK